MFNLLVFLFTICNCHNVYGFITFLLLGFHSMHSTVSAIRARARVHKNLRI
jgi:hypothetical protein